MAKMKSQIVARGEVLLALSVVDEEGEIEKRTDRFIRENNIERS
jgi:hypothetical protein